MKERVLLKAVRVRVEMDWEAVSPLDEEAVLEAKKLSIPEDIMLDPRRTTMNYESREGGQPPVHIMRLEGAVLGHKISRNFLQQQRDDCEHAVHRKKVVEKQLEAMNPRNEVILKSGKKPSLLPGECICKDIREYLDRIRYYRRLNAIEESCNDPVNHLMGFRTKELQGQPSQIFSLPWNSTQYHLISDTLDDEYEDLGPNVSKLLSTPQEWHILLGLSEGGIRPFVVEIEDGPDPDPALTEYEGSIPLCFDAGVLDIPRPLPSLVHEID